MFSQSQSSRVSPERPRMHSQQIPWGQVWMFHCGEKLRFCASFYALKGFDANNLKLGRKDQRGLYSHLSADETVYFKSRHKSAFCLATQNKSWVSNNKWKQMANQSLCKVWSKTKPKFTDYKPSMKCHLRWDTMVLLKSYFQSHPVAAHGTAAKHSTSIKMSLNRTPQTANQLFLWWY